MGRKDEYTHICDVCEKSIISSDVFAPIEWSKVKTSVQSGLSLEFTFDVCDECWPQNNAPRPKKTNGRIVEWIKQRLAPNDNDRSEK